MIEEKELIFLEALRKYENKWVAIHDSGDGEIVVGSGKDAVEAQHEAEANGFTEVALMKVAAFDSGYVPTLTV
jgi:hypothetical protein